ncbi:MAG: OmpA family protein [Crocinitomicaceae bacterium]|nr:OmpA family protein [Crocinitomicaceae bacterium]
MKQFILSIFILSSVATFGQIKQKIANKHFARLEYAKCIEMYAELSQDCFESKKKSDWENVRKAAISSYHLFNMKDAAKYYQQLHAKNMLDEMDREYYIEALRYEQAYEKSNTLIIESASLFPKNPFFKEMKEDMDKFDSLFADSAFYRTKEAAINSGKGDFSAAYNGNSIVFVSKAKNTGFLNPRYGWDNDFFLNMMQSTMNADSSLNEPTLLKHNYLSRAHDGPVAFSPDGKKMVITKNTLGKKKGKEVIVLALYFSELVNGEWSDLTPFQHNNATANVGHGVFSSDGKTLYFVSDMKGGKGEADLYSSTWNGLIWSSPKNLGNKVNTDRNEMFPFVQDDVLYFASDGHFGLGGLDVFEVSTAENSVPHNVGFPVNTSHDDFGLIFDSSKKIGFLSSNRGDNIDRIYHVRKRVVRVAVEGNVFALYGENKETVGEQTVFIKNRTTQKMDSTITDAKGHFSKSLALNNNYQIFTKKDEFISLNEAQLSTSGINKDSTLTCELLLKPTTISIHLRIIEKESRNVIPGATATISNYNTGWDTTLITNDEGMVTIKVDRNIVFWAHGAKKGFVDGDISFNTSNEDGKIIDLELELPKIKKGEKFKLENIFYDLNKSTLRPESMASLDRLADFLLKNDLKIELSAHTDARGSRSYNQRLSQARAQSCVDYLLKKGVPAAGIKAKGYGETDLVNHCKDGVTCTEDEHQENRRTEVKILEVN